MRSWTVSISTSLSNTTFCTTLLKYGIQFLWRMNSKFSNSLYHNLLVSIFSGMQFATIIKQIVQLTLVNLIKRHRSLQTSILCLLQIIKNVSGCQHVQTLSWMQHSKGLSRPCLTVRKAGSLSTCKNSLDERLCSSLIYPLIVAVSIEHLVKYKLMLLDIACEINFNFGFVNEDSFGRHAFGDVFIFLRT